VQFLLVQFTVLPAPEDGPLAVERGYDEAAATVLEGRFKGILEPYLAKMGEVQSFSF
jgi:hypothetical protein